MEREIGGGGDWEGEGVGTRERGEKNVRGDNG